MEEISIDVSTVDEKEEQQVVTLVDASELSNTKENVYDKASFSPHCLICNAKLVVSARGAIEIFSKEVKTSARQLDVDSILSSILKRKIVDSDIHSNILCKKCFKLVNDIDHAELQLNNLKEELTNKYLDTENKILNQNLLKDIESGNGDVCYIIKGGNEFRSFRLKSKGSKRGRRKRARKLYHKGEDVKIEIKEEDLITCFGLDDSEAELDGRMDSSSVTIESDEVQNVDMFRDIENVFDIDGLDIHNTENTIQIGDAILPTINNEELAKKIENELPGIFGDKNLGKFRCRFCKIRKHSFVDIQSHLYEFHSSRLFECEVCNEQLNNWSQLLEHLEQHLFSGKTPYGCNLCRRHYALPRQLRQHLLNHLTKTVTCYKCYKKFRSELALEEHTNTHTGYKPYTCEHCFKNFCSKLMLKKHYKIHTARPRSFKCKICNKLFLTTHQLNDHMLIHQATKNFVCESCGKAFTTKRSLDIHSIIHSGVKNFICRICSKAFTRKGEVEDHERIHTGERPFQCEICGAQFSQKSNLLSHNRSTHLKEKRYECTECSKAFKRRRLLMYHIMSVHTGERPYKCDYCKAAFVYPEHYKKHLRIHAGDKPYKCEICGRAFSSKDNKNAHKFIHSDRKQYECTLCGIGFMRKPQLILHIHQHGRSDNVESYIKVNSSSIVDEELIARGGLLRNQIETTIEGGLGQIQIVQPSNKETVQVLNRSIIIDTDYILQGQVVQVRGDELEDLTTSQFNHITEVAASTSDTNVDEHSGEDYRYFHLRLEDKEMDTSVNNSTNKDQRSSSSNNKKVILYHTG